MKRNDDTAIKFYIEETRGWVRALEVFACISLVLHISTLWILIYHLYNN